MSLLFMRPQGGWKEEIRALASEVLDPELRAAAAAGCREEDPARYDTVFRPGGVAGSREVSYGQAMMPSWALAEIQGYYEAFAYRPQTDEPPDHVALMTGFIAYLRLKQAMGEGEQAQIVSEALQRFIRDHLSRLAEPLAHDLAASGVSYLAMTASLLLRRVREEMMSPSAP